MLFVSERYSTKDIYREKCIQNKFNGEMYVYYKYGSSQSRQRGYPLSVDFNFGQYIINK